MATYLTGRTRHVVFTAALPFDFYNHVEISMPGDPSPNHEIDPVYAIFLRYSRSADPIVSFLAHHNGPDDEPNIHHQYNFVAASIDTGDGSPASDSQISAEYNSGPLPTIEMLVPMSGTITIELDTEECFEFYDPDQVTTIDGRDFPNQGGTAYPYNLPCSAGELYERIKEGSTISFVGTSGDVTISLSKTVGDPIRLPYGLHIESGVTVFQESISGDYAPTFQGEALTAEGANWTDTDVTADFESGAVLTMSIADGPRTATIDAILFPSTQIHPHGTVRTLTGAYPSDITVRIQDYLEPGPSYHTTDVTANPNWNLDIEQRVCDIYVVLDTALPYATNHSLVRDEHCGIRAWLLGSSLTSLGEDSRDWRMQWQLWPWHALTVSQDETLAISSTATLTDSSADLTLSGACREGYRYLRIPYTWSGADTVLVLTLGPKTYDLAVQNGAHVAVIDLCVGVTNLPVEFSGDDRVADERDARWPLDSGPTSDPDIDIAPAQDGWLWGDLSRASSLSITVPEDESLAVGPCELIRLRDAEVAVWLPFLNELRTWTSETDDTYADMDVAVYSDRKQVGPWPTRFHIVPFSGDPSYTYYSLDAFADLIELAPGWHVNREDPPSGYPHLDGDEGSLLVTIGDAAANMDPYLWTGSAFRNQTSLPVPADLWSCVKLDELLTYPGAGDPTQAYGSSGNFPATSKVLRERVEGLCGKYGASKAVAGVRVELVTWSGEAPRGSAVSGTAGRYRTGLTFGFGAETLRSRLTALPTSYEEFIGANRYPHRTSFLGEPSGLRAVGYAVSRAWRHAIAYPDSDDANLSFAPNSDLTLWSTPVASEPAEQVRIAWPARGSSDPLWSVNTYEGLITLFRISAEDGVPTMSIDIGSGDSAAHCFGANGTLFVFRLESGTIYGQAYDGNLNQIGTEWTTNLTGLDTEPIAADAFVTSAGAMKIALLYVIGDVQTVSTSPDGITFS